MNGQRQDALSLIDPRARVLSAAGLCLATVLVQHPHAILLAILTPLVLGALAGYSFRRLVPVALKLNGLFVVMALMTLPFVEGPAWQSVGPLTITYPGRTLMLSIVLKGNALVLCCAVFLSTLAPASLGYALGRLGIPSKFVQLLMSVIRYIDVLLEEHSRLRQAMRARGFCPGFNRRTVRAHAIAVGALFLRSLERAERVADAMKCRGYHGVYIAMRSLHWRRLDSALIGLIGGIVVMMSWIRWFR